MHIYYTLHCVCRAFVCYVILPGLIFPLDCIFQCASNIVPDVTCEWILLEIICSGIEIALWIGRKREKEKKKWTNRCLFKILDSIKLSYGTSITTIGNNNSDGHIFFTFEYSRKDSEMANHNGMFCEYVSIWKWKLTEKKEFSVTRTQRQFIHLHLHTHTYRTICAR